uniref:Uncharacterized protein n=1 Tax=Anguilla anguilla TaxID=7936 RepID=A0A0E9UZW6_ANGAN
MFLQNTHLYLHFPFHDGLQARCPNTQTKRTPHLPGTGDSQN